MQKLLIPYRVPSLYTTVLDVSKENGEGFRMAIYVKQGYACHCIQPRGRTSERPLEPNHASVLGDSSPRSDRPSAASSRWT